MVRIKIDLTKVVLFLSTPGTFTCYYHFSKGGEPAHQSTTVMSCMSSLLHVLLRIPIFFQASKLTSIMKGTEVPNPQRSSACDCTCVLTRIDHCLVNNRIRAAVGVAT